MSRRQTILIAAMAAVGIFAYGGYKFYWLITPYRGDAFETKEVASNSFKIRITAYGEKGAWLPGAYYVFESSPVSSDGWREFMTVRADDPNQILRDAARIINEQAGYAYMMNMYAVTTDGGRTWSIWDAVKELQSRQDIFSRSIEEVEVTADGAGRMRLYSIPDQSPSTSLRTKDYGRHWDVE